MALAPLEIVDIIRKSQAVFENTGSWGAKDHFSPNAVDCYMLPNDAASFCKFDFPPSLSHTNKQPMEIEHYRFKK